MKAKKWMDLIEKEIEGTGVLEENCIGLRDFEQTIVGERGPEQVEKQRVV